MKHDEPIPGLTSLLNFVADLEFARQDNKPWFRREGMQRADEIINACERIRRRMLALRPRSSARAEAEQVFER